MAASPTTTTADEVESDSNSNNDTVNTFTNLIDDDENETLTRQQMGYAPFSGSCLLPNNNDSDSDNDNNDDEDDGFGGFQYSNPEFHEGFEEFNPDGDNVDDSSTALAEFALSSLDDEYESSRTAERIVENTPPPPPTSSISPPPPTSTSSSPSATFEPAFPPLPAPLPLPGKPPAKVDFKRIAAVVKNIRLNAPKLTQNLDAGSKNMKIPAPSKKGIILLEEANDNDKVKVKKAEEWIEGVARSHNIIPLIPLQSYHHSNQRALTSSHSLSRACTIANALDLYSTIDDIVTSGGRNLRLDVCGCDIQEVKDEATITKWFAPLCRWVGAYFHKKVYEDKRKKKKGSEITLTIDILLVGPMIIPTLDNTNHTIAIQPLPHPSNNTKQPPCKTEVNILLKTGSYHTVLLQLLDAPLSSIKGDFDSKSWPHLTISFNSGIWGYDDWLPTLDWMLEGNGKSVGKRVLNFVTTSYTLEEGEDDQDVITERAKVKEAANCTNLFESEKNAFASRVEEKREGENSKTGGRKYFENGGWAGWRFDFK